MPENARTAIIHVEYSGDLKPTRTAQSRLEEAKELARAIDRDIVYERIILLKKRDAGRLIGAGHLEEIAQIVEEQDIALVVINYKLSPVQQRNLERAVKTKVIDRTGLILEIFGARAATREGVLQVQAAHLSYQKSRLVRSWTHLERQRGGAGFMGGPGETQIEADRRALDTQIQAIEKRLSEVRKTRTLQRAGRTRRAEPVVALVGYTNAGKSTLFNALSGADVMAENMLFATLDPTLRRMSLPGGRVIVLSDTVGFVSDLPHELVDAFRATLEEVTHADLVLHIRDAANEERDAQAEDVYEILSTLGVGEEFPESPPIIEVFNKIDLCKEDDHVFGAPDAARISAATGQGLDELVARIEDHFAQGEVQLNLLLPFAETRARAWLHEHAHELSEEVTQEGYQLRVRLSRARYGRFVQDFPELDLSAQYGERGDK